MEEEFQYCGNCKREISAKNYVIHTAHCLRNIQLCNRCSEPVPRSELKEHEEEFHSKDTCSDCGISVERWQIEKHKEICGKKLVPCEYCELEVPLDSLSEHAAMCGCRTEQCLKCNKHVMIKDLKKHPIDCLKREPETMPCEYCGLQIDWNEFMEHTVLCGTRTERCFLCSEHVMVKDRDTHFVICGKSMDFKETVSCDYCEGSFPHKAFERHVELCRSHLEKCKKCNDYIKKEVMEFHLTECEKKEHIKLQFPCNYCGELFLRDFLKDHSDSCGFRTQKCEKCEKFVSLRNMEAHSDMCGGKKHLKPQYSCNYCQGIFPNDFLEEHANRCGSRTQKCKNCGQFILLKNMDAHSDTCLKSSAALGDKTPCKYCGISFPYYMLDRHISACSLQTEKCRKCEKKFRLNEIDGHQCVNEQNISKTYGTCGICHQSIPWIEMNVHSAYCSQVYYDTPEYELQNQFNELALTKESEDRVLTDIGTEEKKSQSFEATKKCSFCSNIFPHRFFSKHLEICLERPYNCDKCLKPMPYRKKEEHSCRNQQTDYMLHDEETEDIKELKKLKKCQFCDKRMTDVLFHHHLKICEYREEKCPVCSAYVPVKDMQEHKLLKCNFADINNRNFYSDNNVYAEASSGPSENFENTRHLELKVEFCPSCNSKIPEERYHEHLLLCYNEMTQCHFCGKEISKKGINSHLRNCDKVLAAVRGDNKSESSQKNGKANKGKSFVESFGKFIPFYNSNKDKTSGRNYSGDNYKGYSGPSNREKSDKVRGPVQPPPTKPDEAVNELPCEFCGRLCSAEYLIEHESGCRPDLMSFPTSNDENDQKVVIAAASASPISHISGMGARSKNSREEKDEWKEIQYGKNKQVPTRENFEFRSRSTQEENTGWKEIQYGKNKQATTRENFELRSRSTQEENTAWKGAQSRRNNQASFGENSDYRKKERNVHQNRSNDKDKFFFYSSQDADEISENQSTNSRQKRHPQMKESPETSKIKSDKEFGTDYGIKKDESGEDRFTAFKFSSSKFNEGSQNNSHFRKKNDNILSSDVKSARDTKKSNSYSFQTFSEESESKIESSKPSISREIKAVGAERTEKKRILYSKKDAEADLTLINKDFEEMHSQKPITSIENNKNEPSKFPETADTNMLGLSLPMIWNTEYNSNNNKTFRSSLLKSLNSNYDSKTEDDTPSNSVENIDHKAMDNKNKDDTSSKAIENIDRKSFDSSIQSTDYDAKNDETFGRNFLEPIKNNQNKEDENDSHSNSDDIFYDADDEYFVNMHGSFTPQEEKLSHNDLDNLNSSHGHQRDIVRQNSYEELEERRLRKYEEDWNNKDSDLNGYIQFLRTNVKGSEGAIANKMNQQEKFTSPLKNESSSSESSDTESFNTRVKNSNQIKSKKNPLKFTGNEKVKDESFGSNEASKWKKWREPEGIDSD